MEGPVKKARTDTLSGGTAVGAATAAGEPHQQQGAPVIRFRNYQPKDATVRAAGSHIHVLPAPMAPSVVEEKRGKEELEKALQQSAAAAAAAGAEGSGEGAAPLNIAPKKPNWDLQRDVEQKLQKLEGETKQAIRVLLRERLLKEREAGEKAAAAGGAAGATAAGAGKGDSLGGLSAEEFARAVRQQAEEAETQEAGEA